MQPDRNDFGGNIYTAGNDLLNQIHIAMIRLDTKTDSLIQRIAELDKKYSDKYSDQEMRIRALEQRPYVAPATVWKVIGALVSIASVTIGLIAVLTK